MATDLEQAVGRILLRARVIRDEAALVQKGVSRVDLHWQLHCLCLEIQRTLPVSVDAADGTLNIGDERTTAESKR